MQCRSWFSYDGPIFACHWKIKILTRPQPRLNFLYYTVIRVSYPFDLYKLKLLRLVLTQWIYNCSVTCRARNLSSIHPDILTESDDALGSLQRSSYPLPLYSIVGFTRETNQWHDVPTLLPNDNQRLLFLAWTFTNFRLIISSGADFANFAVMFWTLPKRRHPLSTMPCLWMRTTGQFLKTVVLAYRNIFIFDKTFPPQLLSLRRNRYIPS